MTDKLIEQIKAEKEEGPVEEGVATVRSEYLNAMEDRILADAKRIEAERQRAEKAESQAAGLAKFGDVLALRLRHIVGPEDIVLRWENARAALRQDEEKSFD